MIFSVFDRVTVKALN